MTNLLKNIKVVDFSSKKTQKVYLIAILVSLISSGLLYIITIINYKPLHKDDFDDEEFESKANEISNKNTKIWFLYSIVSWILGIVAMFKMDYISIGEWYNKHFKK